MKPLTGVHTPRNVLYMETTTATHAELFATMSDDMIARLVQMRFSAFQPAVRDAQGNQRSLTQAEIDFGDALRLEQSLRGLR